jgi:hypothetical protein
VPITELEIGLMTWQSAAVSAPADADGVPAGAGDDSNGVPSADEVLGAAELDAADEAELEVLLQPATRRPIPASNATTAGDMRPYMGVPPDHRFGNSPLQQMQLWFYHDECEM